MTDLINQSVNHKAVYRTAPATPGLVIMGSHIFDEWHEIKESLILSSRNLLTFKVWRLPGLLRPL